jgi:uncharacterized membrane protein YGL010W
MSGGPSATDRVAQYEQSHRHPANRFCHFIGIPLIVVSLVMALVALAVDGMWSWVIALFVAGWILQFIGHVFERKPPEFFKIFAPDFRMINPAGAMTSRNELLGLLASGKPPYRKATYVTDKVMVNGDRVVVATGTESVEYAADGHPQQRRVTQVWQKNGATWQLVLRQATLINPP